MGPLVQKQFELHNKLGSGDLHTSGFTGHLLSLAGELIEKKVSLAEIFGAHVSVLCKSKFSEPTYCFCLTRLREDRKHTDTLQIYIAENNLHPRERNALWRAVPSLAPGGASIRGFHSSVDSIGTFQAESALTLSLPKNMRPLAICHPDLRRADGHVFTLERLMEAVQDDHNLEFGLAFSKDQIPLDLRATLLSVPAPDKSQGTCLDYIERHISDLCISSAMSTIDWNGCWRTVGSASIIEHKQADKDPSQGIVLVSLRRDLFGQGENWIRPSLEVVDLIINATAKLEASFNPDILNELSLIPGGKVRQIEAFAAQRQLATLNQLFNLYSKTLPHTDNRIAFLQSRLETVGTRLSTLLGPQV